MNSFSGKSEFFTKADKTSKTRDTLKSAIEGKKFDYINGALENHNNDSTSEFILQKYSIRKHVCDILEGGEDAFIKRENKYSING